MDSRANRSSLSGFLRHGALLGSLILAGCGGSPSATEARLAQLKQALPTGLSLPNARQALQAGDVTFSEKTAVECENLARQSRVQTQLSARGGPCLFGKWVAPRNGYGSHSDVILQLVFDGEGKLVDGNFETVDGFF